MLNGKNICHFPSAAKLTHRDTEILQGLCTPLYSHSSGLGGNRNLIRKTFLLTYRDSTNKKTQRWFGYASYYETERQIQHWLALP